MNPCIYVLNEAQWAHFWEAMTTPREPTEIMKLAAKRHKELVVQQGVAARTAAKIEVQDEYQ